MKRTHVAFISYPQHPHVGPTLPIVAVLVRRGYRVSYVTSDRFASRVADLGAEVVSCADVPTYIPPAMRENDKGNYQDRISRLADCTLEGITPFYERNRPSLIVYDLAALAGQILVRKWNIPAIQSSPAFAHDKTSHHKQLPDREYRKVLLDHSKRLDIFLESRGIIGSDLLFHREKLNIYLFPKRLQPCSDALDESCFYAGRCAGEQPYYGSWEKKNAEGRPVALVATSTHYVQGSDYFRMCIEALSGLQWHIVLSIGDSGDPASLGPLPPHCEIVQGTSHVKIMPHVSLLVCLGGIITSAEAAYHGVPLIVTTLGFPELEWQAENLASLGVGIHLRKVDMSVENLRRLAIQASEDVAMLDRVKQLQHVVQREPGGEETANRIEELLESCAT